MRTSSHQDRRSLRSGQALIEFAVIAFVMTFLLGAILAFGFLFFSANVLQQAADVGAMELSRHPFAPVGTFDEALEGSGLYSEASLVVVPGTDPETLPLINRLLYSTYIYDPDIDRVRYPGTLVTNVDGDLTVVIPLVGFGNRDSSTGAETISEWRRVVEEVLPAGASEGPFALDSPTPGSLEPGMVALRINFPYQSAALVAYIQSDSDGNIVRPADTVGLNGVQNIPVTADDASVTGAASATFPNGQTLAAAGYILVDPSANPNFGAGPHRGTYGFGEAKAFATTVRPYRKVISAQGIYRREVFE
ncbi:TadE-like protein [Thalassoglobus neptunius]|uniref:TadE-like protein n=1 Tax=Thalassoglobus neptunius TaxID=1938619 RepID=A0A5C5X723_9PLAN|nr:TadE family protein [Thalassoglobus neptunius]TWT58846.1 TadE-like protein [Thalassoglobus neptunius]